MYILEVLCFIKKNISETLSKTARSMNIIQETNMTFTHNLVIHLYFKKSVLHVGVRLYKRLPLKIKKLDNFNRFRKEVKLTLLNNSFYMLE